MSDRRPNKWLSLVMWLLPDSGIKIRLLRRLGNSIGDGVHIGRNLVLGCGPFRIADRATIGQFNVFRQVAAVQVGVDAAIGNLNQFTAAPDYQRFSPLVGRLILDNMAVITNRHYFDCSGLILLNERAGVGGVRSIFQSHEIDLEDNQTKVGRIELGVNAMTGTGCTVLKDAYLPEKCVLGARSLLAKKRPGLEMPVSMLYAGIPARPVKPIDGFDWWDRTSVHTEVTAFDDTQFRLE